MEISENFVSWLTSEVQAVADKYEVEPHRAFPAWAFRYIFDIDDAEAFNETDTLSRGDAGLDGWYLDTENSVLHIAQAKYHADPLASITSPDGLRALIHAALLLKDPTSIANGPHSEKLTKISTAMARAIEDDFSISLDFIVAGRISDHTKSELESSIAGLGSGYSAAFYDTERLHERWISEEPIGDLKGTFVDFMLSGPSEHYEKSGINTPGLIRSAITSLDGRSIGDSVAQFGAKLFHANVRYYLAKSNRVNKTMLETLESSQGRDAFWLYNNGLTIVADGFEFIEKDGGSTALRASNPQIVNGAQTSSVLRDRRKSINEGDVSIQARIIALDQSPEGRSALLKVSEYTNSQSPVKLGDLRSNDLRHRKLQKAFQSIQPPVFYERRRGEWQSLDAATRAQFGKRRVTKEEIGQRYLAYCGKPATAIGDKDSIFGENEQEAFNTQTTANTFLLAYDLFDGADEILLPKNAEHLARLVPSFISDGAATPHLLAMRRSRKLMAAHATALSHEVLKWRYNAIGDARAGALRSLLAQDEKVPTFIWRQAYKAIWTWTTTLSDLSELRTALQRTTTLQQIHSHLQNNLVDLNKSSLPNL